MYQKHSILSLFGSQRRMKLKSQKLLTFRLSVCCVIQDLVLANCMVHVFIQISLVISQHTAINSEEEGIRSLVSKKDEVQGNVMS